MQRRIAAASDVSSVVDAQIRDATLRGAFDDLPGAGKPLTDLGPTHDRDWWLRKMVEREQIALLPPSVQLRHDDAALDERLDTFSTEKQVRAELEEFNARVIHARYTNHGGPPLVTMPRDVEAEVAAWERRRAVRLERNRAVAARAAAEEAVPRRRWWRFGLSR
ncbi:MAG: DUF1992 domain-containing protein [Nocardioides sp.]|uniref:DnaJ family domain-containing protein n=1 Tax=Nocardioides sp. TaxID=35761 RepID=UPI003EFC9246